MKKLLLPFIFCSITIMRSESLTDKEYAALPPVFEIDNFDRCLLLGDEALYCYVEYHVKPIDPKAPSKTWRNIQELATNPSNYRHDNLRHGICVPLTCPNISRTPEDPDFQKELANCYNKKYEHLGLYGTIEHTYCQTNEAPKYDYFDRTVLIVLIAYVLFVIFSSFYEGLARFKSPEEYKKITSTGYGQIISCFSIPKNWIRLKTYEPTPDNERFHCFQGLRFYNMCLVILVHSVLLCVAGPIANTKYAESVVYHPLVLLLASGPYCLSTFFQLSAGLLTYNIMKQYDAKSGKKFDVKTILVIVWFRYIRLIPPLVFIMVLHSSLLYHLGRGPWWDEFLRIDLQSCRNYGWTNLLFINIWVKPSNMCLLETWYLSVDMQAFVLVLVLLYFTVKDPKRFWMFLIGGWIVSHAYLAWYFYKEQIFRCLSPTAENVYMLKGLYDDNDIWAKTTGYFPFSLSGSFVGTGFGFLAYKYPNSQLLTTKTRIAVWWSAIWIIGISIVLFPGMWIFSRSYYHSYWFSIPYMTLGSTIFSLVIGLGAIGVTQGHGWLMKRTLEWPPVYYFGRISYSTFLAHYSLIFFMMGSQKELMSVNDFFVFCTFIKVLALSLIFGLVLSLLTEYPASAVSSHFLKKKIAGDTKKNEIKQKAS